MRKAEDFFANTRVRFQRLNDLRFFYGWVVQVDREILTVRAFVDPSAQAGQVFVFELVSLKGSRTMAGRLEPSPELDALQEASDAETKTAVELILCFSPIRQVKTSESSKGCRKATQLLVGSIRRSSGELDAAICDVSPNGAGILVSKELKSGEKLELVVNANGRELNLRGEVRYCQKDKNSPGMFRAGIQLTVETRLDSAVWTRFMEAA